jgi:hypothetical protein
MMRKKTLPFAVAILLLLGAVSGAQAGAPTTIDIPAVEFDDPFVCGGDPVIHVAYTAPFVLRLYFDADGTLVRDATFGPRSRVIFSDPLTGRSLSGISPAVFRTTYADDGSVESVTVNGLSAAITIPKQGVVLLDTGSITWEGGFVGPTLAERGPHEWLGTDNNSAFCDWFRA